jgi:hypothetical protein
MEPPAPPDGAQVPAGAPPAGGGAVGPPPGVQGVAPGAQGVAAQGAVHFAVDRPTPLVPGGFAEKIFNATTQVDEPTAVLPALTAINSELHRSSFL